MSLQFWAVNNDGDLVEWTDRLPADTLEVTIHAEECSVGNSQITIRDTDAGFNVRGHRLAYFVETDAVGDDWFGIIGPFFVNTRKVTRDLERMGAARTWTISLDDINTLLSRRVQKGADAEREEETDVARLSWLIETAEVTGGHQIEDTTYIFTDAPVTMSESNYRGVESAQVVNDLFQQSGANAYLMNMPEAEHDIRVGMWYGRTEREEFSSVHRISNDPAEISPETFDPAWLFDPSEGEWTFAPSLDAELDRDPSRVYSGAYVNWDGGWSYVQRFETVTDYAARDGVFQAELVKSQARGDARATRYTRDLRNEDDAITCAVIVPNALVHAWVPGHRVEVKFTHLPAYEDWTWMRVAAVTVRQLSHESRLYELALDLRGEEPPETGEPGGPTPPGDVFAVLNRPGGGGGPEGSSGGNLMWASSGDDPKPGWPLEPTQGLLSIIEDLTPDLYPWRFEGILVEGDGTLDYISFRASTAGIIYSGASYTVTWSINVNGISVGDHSEIATDGLRYYADYGGVIVENLAVSAGDVITGSVTVSPVMPYFRIPSGTGSLDERLRIVGGNLT